MPDERNARPVSGEIMAAGVVATEASRAAGLQAADIIDAEFETLRPDPSDRLSVPIAAIGTAAAPSQGLGTLRKRDDQAVRRGSSRGGPIFWTVGMAIAAGAFWVSGGHALIREPGMTSAQQVTPVNPLRISDVASRVEDRGGRGILFVDGRAVNDGAKELSLPPIAISVTGNDGAVMHYRLGTSPDLISPGGQFNFSTRLEAPKEGVKTVSVTFSG